MKTALTESGEPVIAGDGVPETAVCPRCGCRVTLRSRRQMGGEITYFWRHTDNGRVPCSRRIRPYSRDA